MLRNYTTYLVAKVELNIASKTAEPTANTNLCAGILCCKLSLPTINVTSLNMELWKEKKYCKFADAWKSYFFHPCLFTYA